MKKKILVVDDEQTTCFLVENFLSSDYHVITRPSGVEAIKLLSDMIPDLIISDIQMPHMDGFDFIKYVRTMGYTKHTPIIMLSGTKESSERIKCYKLGAQDYLTKPFNPEELKELVRKNLFPINYSNKW